MNPNRAQSLSGLLFLFLLLLAVAGRYFLTLDQIAVPLYWPYDDLLYVNWAANILEGRWLGEFNYLSYSKLPGYSIWMAAVKSVGFPLLLAQQLVSILTAILAVLLLRLVGASRLISGSVFVSIVLAPHAVSYTQTRVLRDFLSGELTLLLLLCSASFLVLRNWWSVLLASLSSGLLLGFYSIIREEWIWVLPFLFSIPFLRFWVLSGTSNLIKETLPRLLLGFVLISGAVIYSRDLIASRNLEHYGEKRLSYLDLSNGPGNEMLTALSRIDSNQDRLPFVSVPTESLDLAYKVSPTFRSIQEPLDRIIKTRFTREGGYALLEAGNILDGFIYFAISSSAAEAGHFASSKQALAFFDGVTTDINNACKSDIISCDEPQV